MKEYYFCCETDGAIRNGFVKASNRYTAAQRAMKIFDMYLKSRGIKNRPELAIMMKLVLK